LQCASPNQNRLGETTGGVNPHFPLKQEADPRAHFLPEKSNIHCAFVGALFTAMAIRLIVVVYFRLERAYPLIVEAVVVPEWA